MEEVGSLICMAKFPWAAQSAAHWAAHFFIFGSSGLPTELPTELPIVSIYGSSGQPNLHGKIPMGSPRAAHSVADVQPMGSEVGSSPVFFRMGIYCRLILCSGRQIYLYGGRHIMIYFILCFLMMHHSAYIKSDVFLRRGSLVSNPTVGNTFLFCNFFYFAAQVS